MKMWIRSQEGDNLSKMKCVKYCAKQTRNTSTGMIMWVHCIFNKDMCIGKYESKERCIEVINEMEEFLTDMHSDLMDNIQDRNMTEVHTVFQMPEK